MDNNLFYALIAVIASLAGVIVAFLRLLMNRQDKTIGWLTEQISRRDQESREDREVFSTTIRQFQEVLIPEIAKWMERDEAFQGHVRDEHHLMLEANQKLIKSIGEICRSIEKLCREFGVNGGNRS